MNKLHLKPVQFIAVFVLSITPKKLCAGSSWTFIYYVYLNLNLYKNQFYVVYVY